MTRRVNEILTIFLNDSSCKTNSFDMDVDDSLSENESDDEEENIQNEQYLEWTPLKGICFSY